MARVLRFERLPRADDSEIDQERCERELQLLAADFYRHNDDTVRQLLGRIRDLPVDAWHALEDDDDAS